MSNLEEKMISRKEIYKGRILDIVCDTVKLPDGKESQREVCLHIGAVCVLPLCSDGTVIMERQFRYPHGRVFLEIPAGKLNSKDEDPLVAAKRELREELDLDVSVGGLYACHTFEYPDFIITLSVYECVALSDFVLKEHESYAWVAPKDLKAEEWAPADADILESLKRVFGE